MVPLALCKQRILQPYDASYDHPLVRILVTRQSYLHSFQIVPSEGVACHSCLGQDKVWKTNYHLFYIIWSPPNSPTPSTTSPPPPHYICVFRRSEWKWVKNLNERVHKIYSSGLIFAGTVNFFFPPAKPKRVPGAYSDQRLPSSALWNTPKMCFFSDWKRPKEGARVALGHFHERVGESPRSDKNFGTIGSRFVSWIWPFEVGIAVRLNFTQ